jgi:hypothetical protein
MTLLPLALNSHAPDPQPHHPGPKGGPKRMSKVQSSEFHHLTWSRLRARAGFGDEAEGWLPFSA